MFSHENRRSLGKSFNIVSFYLSLLFIRVVNNPGYCGRNSNDLCESVFCVLLRELKKKSLSVSYLEVREPSVASGFLGTILIAFLNRF